MKNSFGTIAFAVRCGYSPDPVFFRCWTRLLCSGRLREGDQVIPPVVELPHHWAANTIVHQFLNNSKADTLMMLDDDMEFSPDDIDMIRNNETNWPYGIVQATCCSRQGPHAPIVLMESDDKGLLTPMKPDASDGTLSVVMVGLAFTLIRRSTLYAMQKVMEKEERFFYWGKNGEGEDRIFCERATRIGLKIGVDSNVSVGHRVKISVSYDKYKDETIYHTYAQHALMDTIQTSEQATKEGE